LRLDINSFKNNRLGIIPDMMMLERFYFKRGLLTQLHRKMCTCAQFSVQLETGMRGKAESRKLENRKEKLGIRGRKPVSRN
jgi:hypothetical protein